MGAGSGFSGKGAVPIAPSATALAPPTMPQASTGPAPWAPRQQGGWGSNMNPVWGQDAWNRVQLGMQPRWNGVTNPGGRNPNAVQAIAKILTGGPNGR